MKFLRESLVAVLDDIAAQVGVSRRTVAAVLSGRHEPRYASARQRALSIRRMAGALGYRPNAAAKAISTGRFQHVGLLMGTHYERSNFTRETIRGMHDALQEHGMHLSIWFLSDDQLDDESRLPRFLEQQMVDGLLINYTHALPAHMQKAIDGAGLPIIWLNLKREQDSVYPDDIGAGRQAVEHLHQLGHRRIAFADFTHGPGNKFLPHYSVHDRRDGYAAAMREAGVEPQFHDVPYLLPGTEAVQAGLAVLRQLTRPTAVVCQSPRDATVFEVAAGRLDLKIPADLSLITFGGERQTGSVTVPTILVEPREVMGQAAAEALLRRLDTPGQPCPSRKIRYRLHQGASTSSAPENCTSLQ